MQDIETDSIDSRVTVVYVTSSLHDKCLRMKWVYRLKVINIHGFKRVTMIFFFLLEKI